MKLTKKQIGIIIHTISNVLFSIDVILMNLCMLILHIGITLMVCWCADNIIVTVILLVAMVCTLIMDIDMSVYFTIESIKDIWRA